MNQELLEKYEPLVIELATLYLDNMELELGKKYKDTSYEVNANLSEEQYSELKEKHNIPHLEFVELFSDFQRMEPTDHLQKAMAAFTVSGGNVDIAPHYEEDSKRLIVSIEFAIKDKTLDKIEGLSALEDMMLKLNAMLQIDTMLSDSDPDAPLPF